jgi:hypothetical protein
MLKNVTETLHKLVLIRNVSTPILQCIGDIDFPCLQLSCRTPKWEVKTIHGVILDLAHITALKEDLKQQSVSLGNSEDVRSGYRAGHSIHPIL